jgi:hypothetical protein
MVGTRTVSFAGLAGALVLSFGGAFSGTYADMQDIAPGTGLQSAVVVDTGSNGICQTTAAAGDIQAAQVGQGTPFQTVIKCGSNKVADTSAAEGDTQLVAVGAACTNANTVVVDSGADGIANTTAAVGDVQVLAVGSAPANSPCVTTGADGVADTPDPLGGDDVRQLAVGAAQPNTTVVTCGPNKVADTTANNLNPAGDDVQLVVVGVACANQNTLVIDSGANGVADTRAEGPDLVLKAMGPVRVSIGTGKPTVAKTVKVSVFNVEFGAAAPPSRTYALSVSDGSCPKGTVSAVDSNAASSAPGPQATASIAKGGRITGSFVATFHLEDITSVARNIPYRCAVNVEADVVDPALNGAADDAANTDNNATPVDFEVSDRNDL